MKKVRWGVLSTARIGITKVIPSMQDRPLGEVLAIASRDKKKAEKAAGELGIARAYGSYEELLNDPDVDAIFNPLPNHLHLEWSIRVLRAGKHLLCEKPLTMNSVEAATLMEEAARHPGLKVMEAFMYRFHPQWVFAKEETGKDTIGPVQTIQSFFSYFNNDPSNIRNKPETGGGALLDIGCYCISLSRFIFGEEPDRVLGHMHLDPTLKTDTLISGVLDFSGRPATFTCSTQVMPYQRVNIIGTKGRIEIDIPFNAPLDEPTKVRVFTSAGSTEKIFTSNQYSEQADGFCNAILKDNPVPTPLNDGLNNMKVIDAFRKSAESQGWVSI